MEIDVVRKLQLNDCQIGNVFVNGDHFAYSLEDVSRDVKVYGETAIPSGKYEVIVDYSDHFRKDLPHILNVPGFSGVRLHSGNTSKDTLGCILIGADEWPAMHKISNCAAVVQKLINLVQEAKTATLYVGTQNQIDQLKGANHVAVA